MTRKATRDELKTQLMTWCTKNGYVYYEAINESVRPTAPVWMSMEFFPEFWEPMCIGLGLRREQGTADITVFVKAGTGDDVAYDVADKLEEFFLWVPLIQCEIVDTVSASEINNGDASSAYYGVTVSLNYRTNLEH